MTNLVRSNETTVSGNVPPIVIPPVKRPFMIQGTGKTVTESGFSTNLLIPLSQDPIVL